MVKRLKINPTNNELDYVEDLVETIPFTNLSDVTITSAADNDFLQYDSGTSNWVNVAEPIVDGTGKLSFNDTNSYINSPQANYLTLSATGTMTLSSNSFSIGRGGDSDVTLVFNADTNDGTLAWSEDEDQFLFSDDILIATNEKIFFRDEAIFIHSNADGELTLQGDSLTTVGVAGDIVLGDSTERDMYPQTTAKVNLGKTSNKFNNGYFTNDVTIGNDLTVTGDTVISGDTYWDTEGGGLAFGEISTYEAGTTLTISGTGIGNKVQVTAFTVNGESNLTTPDHTNDHITIVKAGKYLVTISMSFESAGATSYVLSGSLWKNNGATQYQNVHMSRSLSGGGGDFGSSSMSGICDFATNDTIELWIWNETNTNDVIIDDVTLSIVQIGGT